MNGIVVSEGVSSDNFAHVIQWANAKGESFLRQFAGNKIAFPLVDAQLLKLSESNWSIFMNQEFVGMLQVIHSENGNVHIGRFVIDPDKAGHGIGSSALTTFCEQLFKDDAIQSVSLNVYKFNTSAQKAYSKCGFSIISEDPGDDPWSNFHMKKYR